MHPGEYPTIGSSRRMKLPAKLRAAVWIGAGALLLVFALAVAALAIAIHNLSVNSRHARHLGLRSNVPSGLGSYPGGPKTPLLSDGSNGEFVWTSTKDSKSRKTGQSPRWDSATKRWVADHGTLEELRDVELGSKSRPLADGDLLRWERGRIVNARDPMLTQELAHHVDTKIVHPSTGDVLLYNETAGQWRNVPLRAFLTISGLRDVDMPPSIASMLHRGAGAGGPAGARGAKSHGGVLRGDGLEDGARLEYDAKRGHWSYRPPHARAWLSFCIPIDNSASLPGESDKWGHLDAKLAIGKWTTVNPKSDKLSIFAVDQYSNGGMRISRKHSNFMTPRAPAGGGRPSASRAAYRLRATISTVGFPPGAWGFLVGNEFVPMDGGFVVPGSEDQMESFSLETVRNVGYDQSVSLAYNARESSSSVSRGNGMRSGYQSLVYSRDPPRHAWSEPLVQCMRMSIEEL